MFECHVTIDPVFGVAREAAECLAASENFKLAKLFMEKDTPSDLDTFMTGHDGDYWIMFRRMEQLICKLRDADFEVRRAKIEEILFDTKYGDQMP